MDTTIQADQEKTQQKPALTKPKFINTKNLEPGTRVNMHLLVQSVKVVRERKRYEGTVNRIAECVVGDEHGCVNLIAKDEQLEIVKEGQVITVRNSHANVVKEHLRIEIDRWAKVESSSQQVATVNTQNNLSDIEYELVTVNK